MYFAIYILGARTMVFTLNYLELFPKVIEIFWENHVSHWKFFPVFMVNFLGIPASGLTNSALPASRLYLIHTHLKHRAQPLPPKKSPEIKDIINNLNNCTLMSINRHVREQHVTRTYITKMGFSWNATKFVLLPVNRT